MLRRMAADGNPPKQDAALRKDTLQLGVQATHHANAGLTAATLDQAAGIMGLKHHVQKSFRVKLVVRKTEPRTKRLVHGREIN